MNEYKDAWYRESVQIYEPTKADMAHRIMSRPVWKPGHTGRSKWERIGAPIFYHIPLGWFSVLAPWHSPKQRIMGGALIVSSFRETLERTYG